jgi:glycosyltransferase involved in cell wall biosynthesis
VTSYLKAADVFGFASITETQGLVTMEAMAAGLPVVAVDASGTRDIVDNGKQGMLVENDADALANVINRLFRSPKRMENYGKNALKKAETFTVRKCTELLVDVYKQAIQDKADGQNVQVEEIEPT